MSDNLLVNQLTQQPISADSLRSVADLAMAQQHLEESIAKAEEQVSSLKEQLDKVSGQLLPELMDELGLTSFKLRDGASIEVKPYISAKIPEPRIAEAFNWLRENNHDSIIKREIACNFGKGEDKNAAAVASLLRKAKVLFSDVSKIHPQTLKAFCRERIESADATFPKDLFGVFEGKRTKITPAK